MLPARRMEPVWHIAFSVNVARLYTFLYRSSQNDTMQEMQIMKFLSDMMASSTWNFAESINNINIYL